MMTKTHSDGRQIKRHSGKIFIPDLVKATPFVCFHTIDLPLFSRNTSFGVSEVGGKREKRKNTESVIAEIF